MFWRRIKKAPAYFVSEDGDIYSTKTKKLMKPSMSGSGYSSIPLRVDGSYKNMFIHRIVAENFVAGNGEQVNHIDGNKLNNRHDNLEWCTQSENQKHAIETGLRKLKYSRDIVDCILEMREHGLTQKSISDILEVKLSFVKDVSNGRTRLQF